MPAELTDEQLAAIRADLARVFVPGDEPECDAVVMNTGGILRCLRHLDSLLSALESAERRGLERAAKAIEGAATRLRAAGVSVADGLAETYEDAAQIARDAKEPPR